jgi:hypothetical protein
MPLKTSDDLNTKGNLNPSSRLTHYFSSNILYSSVLHHIIIIIVDNAGGYNILPTQERKNYRCYYTLLKKKEVSIQWRSNK